MKLFSGSATARPGGCRGHAARLARRPRHSHPPALPPGRAAAGLCGHPLGHVPGPRAPVPGQPLLPTDPDLSQRGPVTAGGAGLRAALLDHGTPDREDVAAVAGLSL